MTEKKTEKKKGKWRRRALIGAGLVTVVGIPGLWIAINTFPASAPRWPTGRGRWSGPGSWPGPRTWRTACRTASIAGATRTPSPRRSGTAPTAGRRARRARAAAVPAAVAAGAAAPTTTAAPADEPAGFPPPAFAAPVAERRRRRRRHVDPGRRTVRRGQPIMVKSPRPPRPQAQLRRGRRGGHRPQARRPRTSSRARRSRRPTRCRAEHRPGLIPREASATWWRPSTAASRPCTGTTG